MKSNNFLRLIIVSFLLLSSSFVKASVISADEAKAWADEKGQTLLKAFSEKDTEVKYQKLDNLFLNDVDLNHISKFVIGKYWRQMSDTQKTRYQDVFKRYSLAVYKSFPLEFDMDKIKYTIISAQANAKDTNVVANIDLQMGYKPEDRQSILVDFRLHKVGGKIKLIDIKLAESSLILSYRNRFYEMISGNDEDIEWFLEDLETITTSTEQVNEENLFKPQY